eukprot:scaffold110333_cov57-Attheya_sp.AAC.2
MNTTYGVKSCKRLHFGHSGGEHFRRDMLRMYNMIPTRETGNLVVKDPSSGYFTLGFPKG